MTNKFPIGSQWKTRAGHRAVVVDVVDCAGVPKVWYASVNEILIVGPDGRHALLFEEDSPYDLLTPWQEPRKGTFFINVYDDRELAVKYDTREAANYYKRDGRLACVKVDWTENQGI